MAAYESGRLESDGDHLRCHICGNWYISLGSHVAQKHGLTADAYRAEFSLMSKTKLWAEGLRRDFGAIQRDHLNAVRQPREERVARIRVGRPAGVTSQQERLTYKPRPQTKRREERSCPTCGTKFSVKPSQPKRYCCLKCRPVTPTPARTAALELRRTAPAPCIVCGRHAKPRRKGRCDSCRSFFASHGFDKPAGWTRSSVRTANGTFGRIY